MDPEDAIAEIAFQTKSAHGLWLRIQHAFRNILMRTGDLVEEIGASELKLKLRATINRGNWKQKGDAVFTALGGVRETYRTRD